mgnify:FL=1
MYVCVCVCGYIYIYNIYTCPSKQFYHIHDDEGTTLKYEEEY